MCNVYTYVYSVSDWSFTYGCYVPIELAYSHENKASNKEREDKTQKILYYLLGIISKARIIWIDEIYLSKSL